MEKMRLELAKAGHEVYFLAINAASAVTNQKELVDRCSFPLLQDLPDIDAWALMKGVKDDIYVYDANGDLATFLPNAGAVSTNLSMPEGYANLKNAILALAD